MKRVVAVPLSLALGLAASAQSPVPIDKEPRHRLTFENPYVRVFDVLVPPGDTTLFHTHVNDGVSVRLTDARVRDEVLGGATVDVPLERGAVAFVQFPGTLTHRVSNIGSTPFRNVFVEVLPPTEVSPGPAPDDDAGRPLELENDRVRVYRLVLRPGHSTKMHTHALRGLGVALSGGRIAVEAPGKKTKVLKLRPGDTGWIDAGTTHSLRNIGSGVFEAVDIELK